MDNDMQPDKISREWLRTRGWSISQAAKVINRSRNHVATVLRGERHSAVLERKLRKLPLRSLYLREHVTH